MTDKEQQLKLRQDKWRQAKEMKASGRNINQIAKELGVSYNTIERWMRMDHPPTSPSWRRVDLPPINSCLECGQPCTHKFCCKLCCVRRNNRTYFKACALDGCQRKALILGYCRKCAKTRDTSICTRCARLYATDLGCLVCSDEQIEVDRVTAKYGLPVPDDKYWQQQLNYDAFEGC